MHATFTERQGQQPVDPLFPFEVWLLHKQVVTTRSMSKFMPLSNIQLVLFSSYKYILGPMAIYIKKKNSMHLTLI